MATQGPKHAWYNSGGARTTRETPPGSSAKRGTPPPGDLSRGGTPSARGGTPSVRGGTPSGDGAKTVRPSSVPLSSSQAGSKQDLRQPLERLLDRRLHSVSTFVSSTQSGPNDSLLRKSGEMSGQMKSQWSEEMPSVIMFPTNRPCSRADAVVLNRWVTNSLGRYADKLSSTGHHEGNLSQVVDELVPVLSIGLHEVVRQVTQHCLERGVVLEKIWRTYVELFERAISETRALLRFHRDRSARVKKEHERYEEELRTIQQRHPEQIQKLSKTLNNKFSQRQEELEENLHNLRHENNALKQHLREHIESMNAWFPRFDTYKESSYRELLKSAPQVLPVSTAPEARVAADFKRIITAMPEDGRRRVGFFVSSLLGLRDTDILDPDTVESLTEQRDHNAWQIDRLQQRIKDLQGAKK